MYKKRMNADYDFLGEVYNKGIPIKTYDLVINSQEAFDEMLEGGWNGVETIAIIGIDTDYICFNKTIVVPETVMEIKGFGDVNIHWQWLNPTNPYDNTAFNCSFMKKGSKIENINFAFDLYFLEALLGDPNWYCIKNCKNLINCNILSLCKLAYEGIIFHNIHGSTGIYNCNFLTVLQNDSYNNSSDSVAYGLKGCSSLIRVLSLTYYKTNNISTYAYSFADIDGAWDCSSDFDSPHSRWQALGSEYETTAMWHGTNKGISSETCKKTRQSITNEHFN